MSGQELCCKYCKKIFQNNFNLTKHLDTPTKKCTERMRYDINLQTRQPTNFIRATPIIQNQVPVIQNQVPVTKEILKEVVVYKNNENEINEYKQQILELESRILELNSRLKTQDLQLKTQDLQLKTQDIQLEKYKNKEVELKKIIYEYQKDYFDCLDKYALQIKEISELKKQIIKEELTQSLELKYISLSKISF